MVVTRNIVVRIAHRKSSREKFSAVFTTLNYRAEQKSHRDYIVAHSASRK